MDERIKQLIERLKTQDNRITSIPIFFVQVRERTYGFDSGWTSDYIWIGQDGEEERDEEIITQLEEQEERWRDFGDKEDLKLKGYYQCYYKDEWVDQQPFFTEAAAQKYIEINGHNLCEPRIYVESGYRNDEWELIRQYFLNLVQ